MLTKELTSLKLAVFPCNKYKLLPKFSVAFLASKPREYILSNTLNKALLIWVVSFSVGWLIFKSANARDKSSFDCNNRESFKEKYGMCSRRIVAVSSDN